MSGGGRGEVRQPIVVCGGNVAVAVFGRLAAGAGLEGGFGGDGGESLVTDQIDRDQVCGWHWDVEVGGGLVDQPRL
jgi:hypothetical protein